MPSPASITGRAGQRRGAAGFGLISIDSVVQELDCIVECVAHSRREREREGDKSNNNTPMVE